MKRYRENLYIFVCPGAVLLFLFGCVWSSRVAKLMKTLSKCASVSPVSMCFLKLQRVELSQPPYDADSCTIIVRTLYAAVARQTQKHAPVDCRPFRDRSVYFAYEMPGNVQAADEVNGHCMVLK